MTGISWAVATFRPCLSTSFPSTASPSHVRHCSNKSSLELDTETPVSITETSEHSPPKASKSAPGLGRVDKLLKALRSPDDVETVLHGWDKSLSARNIVTVLNNISRWDKALQFFEWLKAREDKYEVNTYTYNVMLKILRNGRQYELSEKLFDEMTSRGLEPDKFTYSTLMNCAKRCSQPEEALKWFRKMKEAGIVPDQVTYNSVIDLYGRMGWTNEAIELYEKLRSLKWKLDTVTYGALANVYARIGDYKSITRLVDEMREAGEAPNVAIMNSLIGALSKAGKVSQAREAFNNMVKDGMSPSPVTLSILIEMYSRVGAYDRAFEAYNTVSKTKGWKGDVAVFNSLLKACVECGKVEEMEEIMEKLEKVGCKPNHITYRTAMNTYATKGLVDSARRMFKKVAKLQGRPDTPLYTVLLRACKMAGDMKQVAEVFNDMVDKGCTPDERVTQMLLSCLALAKDAEERQYVLDCLEKYDTSLHELISSILSDQVQVDELARKVEDFILAYPSTTSRRPVCNSLIDICCSVGMKQTAHKVLCMGVSVGAYDGLQTSLPSLWRLNLRTLSIPAAECAVEAWVSSLRLVVREEEELPQDLVIETGVGRERNGQRLSPTVRNLLKKMEAPFTENTDLAGFYSTGPVVEAWIKAKLSPSNAAQSVPALPVA